MNSSALAMMLVTEIVVTGFTIYYFVKVLKTPPKKGPDPYKDKDEK